MRGAKNTQGPKFTYLNFMAGKFVERVSEDIAGAKARELKKGPNAGKVIYELHFDTYEGAIYNIETEDRGEYGLSLNIFIDVSTEEDPDSKVKLSLPLSSGPAKGFLSRLPVIDLAKDVVLKGYNIENKETGRFNQYLVPYQGGQKLEAQFTKDNPNGLPPMKKIKVKGADVWDDTDQLEFYSALIKNTFTGEIAPQAAPEVTEEEENDVIF